MSEEQKFRDQISIIKLIRFILPLIEIPKCPAPDPLFLYGLMCSLAGSGHPGPAPPSRAILAAD